MDMGRQGEGGGKKTWTDNPDRQTDMPEWVQTPQVNARCDE